MKNPSISEALNKPALVLGSFPAVSAGTASFVYGNLGDCFALHIQDGVIKAGEFFRGGVAVMADESASPAIFAAIRAGTVDEVAAEKYRLSTLDRQGNWLFVTGELADMAVSVV